MKQLLFSAIFLLWPVNVLAHPVINEVLWMGSDVSTSDEWIEIYNPDSDDIDLSGWSVWTKSSSGENRRSFLFQTGATLGSDAYLIIARKSASTSALAQEPDVVVSDFSLLNTGLYLSLRDAVGNLVDEADDGSGAPFAGANPSGGGKASMERIDPFASGALKENWQTATASEGFDAGSIVLGTPGLKNSTPPHDDDCSDPLEIGIAVQSGPLVGVGKVTLNLQAVALVGTLGGAQCQWSYGDGFTSSSCNPPSHSFTHAGSFTVHLEVRNTCGETLVQDQPVEVLPDPSARSDSHDYDDGSRLILRSALPDPIGSDTGKEWIEIMNPEAHAVALSSWRLRVGKDTYKWYDLEGSIAPSASLRVYGSEVKLSLPNTASEICLVTPNGTCLSVIEWQRTEEDREYFSTDLRNITVRGRMVKAIGSTVFFVQLEPDAASILGEADVFVKLRGIVPTPDNASTDYDERQEILQDLTEGKKVELEFDTEMWDSLGRLLAYVSTDQQLTLQQQMLVTGKWMIDRDQDFSRKELFVLSEKQDVRDLIFADEAKAVIPVLAEPVTHVTNTIVHDPLWDTVKISEVFASPSPKITEGILSEEWLELDTNGLSPLSLSGFVLQVGTKKKSLSVGLKQQSGAYILVSTTELKLPLKNDGALVALFAPDGLLLDSLAYPKLAYGLSFVRTDDSTCVTSLPTPASENICVSKTKVSAQTSAKKSTKVSPAVKKYAAYYTAQQSDDGGRTIELAAQEGDPQGIYLVLMFVLGVGCGVGFVYSIVFRYNSR